MCAACRLYNPVSRRDSQKHIGPHARLLRPSRLVVMDIEGDLGIELILGRPFLRAARARIDVGRGEIPFHVGKENMFFRFKQREEQRILNRQDDEGQALWDALESPPARPTTTRSKRRRAKKVWRKVTSSSSSNFPGRAEQW